MTVTTGAFTAEEYSARVARVRALMAADHHDLDALVVTSPENIYYLIGLNHQGYFAFTMLLLPREGEPTLMTRRMEAYIIGRQVPGIDHVGYGDDEDAASAAVQTLKAKGFAGGRVGVDRSSMFLPAGIWEDLEEGLSGVEWIDTSRTPSSANRFRTGLVDEVRLIKSDAELEYVRQAAAISDRAVNAGMATAGAGVNETEVAAAVYEQMILGGGEYPGFVPLIRSSDSLLEEHSTWRDRGLLPGEQLFIELSAARARYHAPLTRMAHITPVERDTSKAQALAIDALNAVVGALKPGVTTGEVYDTWQQVVDEGLGHQRLRRHHCGYSVGIGFPPSWVGGSSVLGIRRGGKVIVTASMTFHLLSWITDERLGDHFVSETVVVGEQGAELLTTAPHTLVIG
jgi:Xaa-Pro dipeptidase